MWAGIFLGLVAAACGETAAAPTDTPVADAAVPDGAVTDATVPDGAAVPSDAGSVDASVADSGPLGADASVSDGAIADGALADGGPFDASPGDASPGDAGGPLQHVYFSGRFASEVQWSEPANLAGAGYADLRWLFPVGTRWLFVGEAATTATINATTVDRLRLIDRQSGTVRLLACSGAAMGASLFGAGGELAPQCPSGGRAATGVGWSGVAGMPTDVVPVGVRAGKVVMFDVVTAEFGDLDPTTLQYTRATPPIVNYSNTRQFPAGVDGNTLYAQRYAFGAGDPRAVPHPEVDTFNIATGVRLSTKTTFTDFAPKGFAGGQTFESGDAVFRVAPYAVNQVWSFAGNARSLFVADRWNNRVLRMDVATKAVTPFVGVLGTNKFLAGGLPAGSCHPSALALDEEGTLFIGDSCEHVITMVRSAGNL